ncbi:MAG: polyisoprenyl-teichoic acid--peptidoglycan teichoic acid transferase [Chloroflexota bacterium]|nr:polyisoprenyl-teichoic acid--peptidoglycan teichoic acid transferase [Chloroflexota bacterium]
MKRVLLILLAGSYACYVGVGFAFGATTLANPVRSVLAQQTSAPGATAESVADPDPPVPALVSFAKRVAAPLDLVPDWTGTSRVNVLILGIDQRPDQRDGGIPTRSDVVMIASLDPVHKTAALLSIPRDLWVTIPIPGRSFEAKITTAHFYGDYYHYPGGAMALARRAIEQNFGIPIDYAVRVNFEGFRQIVNTMGGVDVCVPTRLLDTAYPTDDYGIKRVDIPAGRQHFDGETALEYARSRHQDSDFGRSRRQQQVVLALRQQAAQPTSLLRLPVLLANVADAVDTDLSIPTALALARLASQIQPEVITQRVIEPPALSSFLAADGEQALRPNWPAIRQIVGQLFYDPATFDPRPAPTALPILALDSPAGTPVDEAAAAPPSPAIPPAQAAPAPC